MATLFSDPVRIGTATVRQDGTARFSVRIPQIEPGDHSLVISGTNQEGEQATVSRPVVIGVDVTPPALVGVTAAASSVDITAGSTTFNVDISASDVGTGIIAGGVSFSGCGNGSGASWNDLGDVYPDGNIVSGTNTNGTWRVPVTVIAGLSACTLELNSVDLCDATDQCVTFRESLPALSVSVVNNDSPDVTPPTLGSVTVSTDSVDITSGPATFTVDVSASDVGTGIIAGGVSFSGCGNGSGASWNDLGDVYPDGNIVSGTNTNGTWRVPVTVIAGLSACTLELNSVDLCDATDQCVTFRESLPALSVSVVNNDSPDVTPPTLGSVTVSTDSVDITSGPATFTVDVSASDVGTGIIAGGVSFSGCGNGSGASWNDLGDVYPDGNIVSGTNTNGTWRVSLTVPAGIAACTLELNSVDLCDATDQCVTFRESLPALSVAVTRSDTTTTTTTAPPTTTTTTTTTPAA